MNEKKADRFIRTRMLLGGEAMEKLKNSNVAIFGIGGVGSYTAEGLARCGVGRFLLVDDDKISASNVNRQLHAVTDTIGRYKTEVMKERLHSINPEILVVEARVFVLPDRIGELITEELDYVVDALDTVAAKLAIAEQSAALGIPAAAAMGTGNKKNPAELEVADIYDTAVCPLCRVMRRELKKRGIPGLKVVYSREEPIKPAYPEEMPEEGIHEKRAVPGSVSFVPSVAGLILAGEVVKDLTAH